MGYQLSFLDYTTFANVFDQIFADREYDFKTDKKTPLIIDCGSNIGLSIFFFKREYPQSRVIGFEPDPNAFAILQDNITRNNLDNIELHNVALYDDEGTVNFYSDLDEENTVGMSVTKRLLEKNKRLKEIQVQSVLLSNYISEEVDLLKIDIEGVELKVLRELSQQKKLSLVKQMIIEYHFSHIISDNSLVELLEILDKEGFEYIIHSPYPAPYYRYRFPLGMMIYAFQKRDIPENKKPEAD